MIGREQFPAGLTPGQRYMWSLGHRCSLDPAEEARLVAEAEAKLRARGRLDDPKFLAEMADVRAQLKALGELLYPDRRESPEPSLDPSVSIARREASHAQTPYRPKETPMRRVPWFWVVVAFASGVIVSTEMHRTPKFDWKYFASDGGMLRVDTPTGETQRLARNPDGTFTWTTITSSIP